MSKIPNVNLDPGAPQSQESEEAVLGAIIIDPKSYDLAAKHITSHKDFFFLRHQYIWQAMERIISRTDTLDHIVLAEELEAHKVLDEIGGRAFLIQLSNNTGTSMHTQIYAQMVANLSTRRKLMVVADTIKMLATDETNTLEDVRKGGENAWTDALGDNYLKRGKWANDVVSEAYDIFEKALQHQIKAGLSTGIKALDDIIIGHEPSTLSVWAGRPGMGKSVMFLTMAKAACEAGETIAIFTSEMSEQQVMNRLIAMVAHVPTSIIKSPRTGTKKDAQAVTKAMATIAEWKLFIDDTPEPTPRHIRAVTKLLHKQYGVKNVFVDGIYLMTPDRPSGNEVTDLTNITKGLREIARTFNIAVAATHQLNRAVENREDKRPRLSDLRGSGGIEQTVDKVIFLYRDAVYNEATEQPNRIDFIISKHRDGDVGSVSAWFIKKWVSIVNATMSNHSLDD